MLIQDVITIAVLSLIVVSAIFFSVIGYLDVPSRIVENIAEKNGKEINWDKVYPNDNNMHNFMYSVYGLKAPEFTKEYPSVLWVQNYIKKQLKIELKHFSKNVSLKDFTLFFLTVHGNDKLSYERSAKRSSYYDYNDFKHSSVVKKVYPFLSLHDVYRMMELGFVADKVYSMALAGLNLEQIIEAYGIPTEWAGRIYATEMA